MLKVILNRKKRNKTEARARLVDHKLVHAPPPPGIFIAGRPKAALLFWFFGELLNVRLPDDHLYGKLLFTWLSLVVSVMVSFYAVLFPTRCLG